MSDVEKDAEAAPAAAAPTATAPTTTAPTTAASTAGGAKSSTFLEKLSLFTIGRNRGELPVEKKEEADAEADENATPPPPPTTAQKVWRHYRRFWIIYLVVLIVLLAILLPCLFLLIIPRIAQDLLDSGSIVIDSASILQPQSNSVILSIQSHIYVPGPFYVNTDTEYLQLYVPQVGSDYPMVELTLPGTTVHQNTSMAETGQFTPFENYSSWQSFVHNTIFLDDGALGMKGTVGTTLGKIKKFYLNLDKISPSKALNQFSGFSIDSATLVLPAESDGTNLIANATLPNQSVLTLEIGNTTVDILAGNITIGKGVIENLYLQPGNNSVQIRGVANLTTILDNIGDLIAQQREYIKNGFLSLTTQVTDISYNGSTVPYYTAEMGKLPLTAQTPLLGLLLNTIAGYLHGAANTTNVTSLANSGQEDSNSTSDVSRLKDILNNSTELEVVARRHLEKLVKL